MNKQLLLGAASPPLEIPNEEFKIAIKVIFSQKGAVVVIQDLKSFELKLINSGKIHYDLESKNRVCRQATDA